MGHLPSSGHARTFHLAETPTPEEDSMSREPVVSKPETMYREKQVLEKFAPVHRVTWWRWVKAGIAPPPVALGPKATAWRESDLKLWQSGEWPPKNSPNPA